MFAFGHPCPGSARPSPVTQLGAAGLQWLELDVQLSVWWWCSWGGACVKLHGSEIWIPLFRGRALTAKSSPCQHTWVFSRGVAAPWRQVLAVAVMGGRCHLRVGQASAVWAVGLSEELSVTALDSQITSKPPELLSRAGMRVRLFLLDYSTHSPCVHACLVASVKSDSFRPHGLCPPGCSVQGVLQARILEWAAISSSRGSVHSACTESPRNITIAFVINWEKSLSC